MFYYLDGTVAEILPGLAVIDCGGVGYACMTTNNTLSQLKKGEKKKLYTYLNVGESIFDLYGFATQNELNSFKLLLGVSGVGPKAALAILSANTPEGLAMAIVTEDAKSLTAAQGIGKKIAQRIILELKDKMAKETASGLDFSGGKGAAVPAVSIDFGNDIYEEPIVAKTFLAEDAQESSLRPKTLAEYIGQEKAKENLSIFIQAARKRQESLDHVLLHGPPGLGKTTLAGIIAQEMGVNIRITSGPAIEKPGDLAALLTNLNEGDILFVDEIHRLNRSVEEILYPAMEDYALDIIVGKGPSANSIRLDLPHFTLIGATTRAGQLSAPLRDRFGVTLRLELYTPEELSKIVTRSAGILNCAIVPEGAYEIARRSRGTPRIANRMLRRVRDFADVKADGVITKQVADEALCALEIDYLGLDPVDRRMMAAIIENYNGGPVGLETLAATIGEESVTLEDVYEPYLMQLGFLTRTPRGRCVTQKAYQHLHKPVPGGAAEGPLMDQLTF